MPFGMQSVCRQRKNCIDSAKTGGVTVRIRGEDPTGGEAELMYTAMQVCLTNAIQHANATELSANIWENERSYTVVIRNNGKPPEKNDCGGGRRSYQSAPPNRKFGRQDDGTEHAGVFFGD